MTTPQQIMDELAALSQRLSADIDELGKWAYQYAVADHEYRKAKASAYLGAKTNNHEKLRVSDIDAIVDEQCEAQRLRRNIADARRLTALEAVRSRRQQLSALQSGARAVRADIEMNKYDQDPASHRGRGGGQLEG